MSSGPAAPASAGREAWRGVVEEFRAHLALRPDVAAVTLLEGNTPLVPAQRTDPQIDLHFKIEGQNPTGSFKDRGMAVAVSGAVADGARVLLCASTGNTAASAAAFAARAGLISLLAIPAGAVAMGKLSQAIAFGARVAAVRGNFDEAFAAVRALAARRPDVALVNSVNPLRLEGQKTAAFEVVRQLGDAPDWLCIPVGNAGNISAYWRGFREFHAAGRASRLPRLLGVQAAGAAPLVRGEPVDQPETVATAIRIGRPANAALAEAAVRESGGRFLAVDDEAILRAYRFLATREGVFVEPASSASVAGMWVAREAGVIPAGARVVCVLTGNGLKDPERAVAGVPGATQVDAHADALETLIA